MGKILTLPSWMSASMVASNSDVGTVTDNANGTITVTNVHNSTVKNVLAETTNSVSTLCKSANINGWSYWSPLVMGYDSTNMAFTFTTKTSSFNLGDFAAYNHQAAKPSVNSSNTDVYTTTLSGNVNVSSNVQLGEIDWNRKYIGQRLFNYVWVEAENVVDGVTHLIRASAAISSTNGQAYATALSVPYKIPKKGSDSITVRTFLGDSAAPLVKLSDTAGSLTWSYTLNDKNCYFGTPVFDKATASGSGFNSNYDYFLSRGTESIDLNGNYLFQMDINERNTSTNTIVGKDCATNNIYIAYTDSNGISRKQLVASNLPFYAGDPKSEISGTLTYPPKQATDLIVTVKDAVLS